MDLQEPGFREPPERSVEGADLFVRETIEHVCAALLPFHEPCSTEPLKMVGGVGDGLADLRGYRFHRPGALAKKVQDLKAWTAREGLADPRELVIDAVFPNASWALHIQVLV
jgi:hypothetical protein